MPSYIAHETKTRSHEDSFIRIYPLVCLHLGVPQCDLNFIAGYLKRAKTDPNGRIVYMGDLGDCVTKLSKGDIYGQQLSPQQQLELGVELLEPLKDKIIFGIRGNHGNRIYKEAGLSFDANLCRILGVPYLGVSAFLNLTVNRSSYDLFFHHGVDSGIPLTAKIRKAEGFGYFINADGIFTAHSHIATELQPSTLLSADNGNRRVGTKLRHQYICGSAYDSRTGYAEDKGYPPLLPSYIIVEFDGRIIKGKAQYSQRCEIVRATGQ